jgi:hypothetical protein
MTQYNDTRHDIKNSTLYRMTKHDDTHSKNKNFDTLHNDTKHNKKVTFSIMHSTTTREAYTKYRYAECHWC